MYRLSHLYYRESERLNVLPWLLQLDNSSSVKHNSTSVEYLDSFGPSVKCPRFITDWWNSTDENSVVNAVNVTCLDGKKLAINNTIMV